MVIVATVEIVAALKLALYRAGGTRIYHCAIALVIRGSKCV